MVKTMKQDITKTIQFSNTFRYFDDTSASSTEAGYLDTNIKTGDINTPFRLSIYDKRDDFPFRIVKQHTVFIYLNCWDTLEFARPKLTS